MLPISSRSSVPLKGGDDPPTIIINGDKPAIIHVGDILATPTTISAASTQIRKLGSELRYRSSAGKR